MRTESRSAPGAFWLIASAFAALVWVGVAGGCTDLEPTGTDTGAADGRSGDGAVDSGRSTPDADTSTGEPTDSGSDTRRPPGDADAGPAGPGACCTRDGCVYVDAGSACRTTFLPGAQCSNVQCGFGDR